MVKIEFIKAVIFGYLFKKSPHLLFGAWSFLLIHILYSPSARLKNFVN